MRHYRGILFIALGIMAITAMAEDDMRAAYESLAVSNLDATAIQNAFDLNHADASSFMLARMNSFTKKGDGARAEEVMASILRADPGKGIEWLLDKCDQFSAVGRANVAQSLRHSDTKEAYEMLSALLTDKEAAVNEHAAAVAPISPTKPYVHLRVCDFAFNSLVQTLGKDGKFPSDLPRRLSWDTATDDRDRAINCLADWWTQEAPHLLRQKTSLAAARPSLQEKVHAFEKKQK